MQDSHLRDSALLQFTLKCPRLSGPVFEPRPPGSLCVRATSARGFHLQDAHHQRHAPFAVHRSIGSVDTSAIANSLVHAGPCRRGGLNFKGSRIFFQLRLVYFSRGCRHKELRTALGSFDLSPFVTTRSTKLTPVLLGPVVMAVPLRGTPSLTYPNRSAIHCAAARFALDLTSILRPLLS